MCATAARVLSSLLSSLLLALLLVLLIQCGRSRAGDGVVYYTDRWAVQIRGGEHVARRLAARHGFEFIAKVMIILFCIIHFVRCQHSPTCVLCSGNCVFSTL